MDPIVLYLGLSLTVADQYRLLYYYYIFLIISYYFLLIVFSLIFLLLLLHFLLIFISSQLYNCDYLMLVCFFFLLLYFFFYKYVTVLSIFRYARGFRRVNDGIVPSQRDCAPGLLLTSGAKVPADRGSVHEKMSPHSGRYRNTLSAWNHFYLYRN